MLARILPSGCWKVPAIPDGFEFRLLPEDWDHFEILLNNAIHRTPCLETAEIRMLLNGPESFTPDGNFILGEAPELRRYFVCAGFNSAGIANAGGAGRLIAEWIMDGEAPVDLWDVDIRRFAAFHANRRLLADRLMDEARARAAQHRFFHWEIGFPNVWSRLLSAEPGGGFDAVDHFLGDPFFGFVEIDGEPLAQELAVEESHERLAQAGHLGPFEKQIELVGEAIRR